MEQEPKPRVLALVRDLMFSGRISAEARAAGVECKVVRDPAQLASVAGEFQFLLVDLNLDGAIPAAKTWRESSHLPVIAFVAHVDGDLIAQARAAGFEQVMPRGKFVTVLPDLLKAGVK